MRELVQKTGGRPRAAGISAVARAISHHYGGAEQLRAAVCRGNAVLHCLTGILTEGSFARRDIDQEFAIRCATAFAGGFVLPHIASSTPSPAVGTAETLNARSGLPPVGGDSSCLRAI